MLSNALSGSPYYKWFVFAAVGLGSFTGVMTFGTVNVALPTIAGYFETDLPSVQWVVIAQALTISALLLPMGRLSDMLGRKQVYIAGLMLASVGIFTISRVSETTPLAVIIGAMVVQSAGTGLFGSPNSASIFASAEGNRHGVVSALLSLVRNSANVTSVAVATAVVTATMVSMGYTPDLGAIGGGESQGMQRSFVSGMNVLYLAMGCLLLVGVAVSFLKGPAPTREGRVPQRGARMSAGD